MPACLWMALMLASPGQATNLTAPGLIRRAIFEYDTGSYQQALVDLERAYELDPRPALLFNVGLCQRALGRHRAAAIALRSYLREMPRARNRAKAEALLAEMDKRSLEDDARPRRVPAPAQVLILPTAPGESAPMRRNGAASSRAAAVPAAATTAVTAPRPARQVPAGAWWLGGSGVGVGVVGTVLYGLAAATLAGDHPVQAGGYVEHQISRSAFNAAATEGNTGEALWAVGGALLVTGVIVALVGGDR